MCGKGLQGGYTQHPIIYSATILSLLVMGPAQPPMQTPQAWLLDHTACDVQVCCTIPIQTLPQAQLLAASS